MATFRKTVLQVGKKYKSPDGEVVVTKDRLKHWSDTFQAMSAAGAVIPISFDHATDNSKLLPLSVEDYAKQHSAKNTVGKLSAVKVSEAGDSAELTLEITDPTAEGRAERNEVFVSPVIFDKVPWKHGSGAEFTDCFTHVDLVNHPVDHSQGPFAKVDPGMIACALRMGLDTQIYRLAEDDENPFAGKDKDADNDGKSGEGDKTAESAEAENPDMPPAKATDKTKLAAVVAGFSQLGMVLPSDFDFSKDGSIDVLLTSLNTLIAAQNKAEAEASEKKDNDDTNSGDVTVADPGYAAMSLYAENMHRDRIKAQLDDLLKQGQCTPDEAKRFGDLLGTVKLSVDASGKQLTKSDVETFIAHRQEVPKGTFWSDDVRTRMSTVVEPPASMRSELTPAEIQDTANWALGRKPATAGK